MSNERPDRRARPERRAEDRRVDPAKLPVPVEGSAAETPPKPRPQPAAGPDAAFSAQLMAGTPKRGLKGGPETLDKARSTYLGAEYSGANDRRPKKGRITKTEI